MFSKKCAARKLEKQSHDFLDYAVPEIERAGKEIAQYAYDNYPHIADEVTSYAKNAYRNSQDFLRGFSGDVQDAAQHFGRGAQGAFMCVAKLALGYGVFKFVSASSDETDELAGKVKAYINEKPVESAFIALGTGYLLSKILR